MNISNFKSGLNYDFPPPFFGLGLPSSSFLPYFPLLYGSRSQITIEILSHNSWKRVVLTSGYIQLHMYATCFYLSCLSFEKPFNKFFVKIRNQTKPHILRENLNQVPFLPFRSRLSHDLSHSQEIIRIEELKIQGMDGGLIWK